MIINWGETIIEAMVKEHLGIEWDKNLYDALEEERRFYTFSDFADFFDELGEPITYEAECEDGWPDKVLYGAWSLCVREPEEYEEFIKIYKSVAGENLVYPKSVKVGDTLELDYLGETDTWCWILSDERGDNCGTDEQGT